MTASRLVKLVPQVDLLLNLESKESVRIALVARFPKLMELPNVLYVLLVIIKSKLVKMGAINVLLVIRARQVPMSALLVLLDSIKVNLAKAIVIRVL